MHSARRETLAAAIAMHAQVARSDVLRVDIAAGSIVINATLRAPNATAATVTASRLAAAATALPLAAEP